MNTKRIILTVSTCAGLMCGGASAQQEAIPASVSGDLGGYISNGAGFAFSPNIAIEVTALGYAGEDIVNNPYQVSLFDAGGNLLASQTIATSNTLYNQSYYNSISPVQLTAGVTYYVGAEIAGTNLWLGDLSGPNGTTFLVNSNINYLNGAGGFMPPGTVPGISLYQTNYPIGANFIFTNGSGTSASPPYLFITQVGTNAVLSWSTNAAGFLLENNSSVTAPGNWMTVSPGPTVVNGTNYVTNGIGPGNNYYRLRQP
jgi:hypothetical protein